MAYSGEELIIMLWPVVSSAKLCVQRGNREKP